MSMPPTTFIPDTNTTPCYLCESSACHADQPLLRIKLNTDTVNNAPTARLLRGPNEHVNTRPRHGTLNKHNR